MSNYLEKLKDPRWQKKRLEIMERDQWTCRDCGNTEKELHVHHIFYYKNYCDPWEYRDEHLITLCKDCHEKDHQADFFVKHFSTHLNSKGVTTRDIAILLARIYMVLPRNGRHAFCDISRSIMPEALQFEVDEEILKPENKIKLQVIKNE